MLSKSQVENLAQPVVDIYNSLENDMLVNIAKRLAGKDSLLKDDPEAWKLEQLQNLGMLDKDNLNLIKKYAGLTSAQLNSILYGAGLDGLDETDGALEKATKKGAHLKVPVPVSESPAILNIIKAYQMQAGSILNFTNQTMLGQAKSIFVDIINRTTMDVISGFKSSDQALRSTIKQWAEYGVPALVDKAGKKWSPEGYVRMVVATTTHNTVHKMQDERFTQWGIELVEVSSHSGARPLCAPYQGKIYRIDGRDKKYKNLYTDTSYGQPAGLFGINCGHHKYPYVEGVSTQTFFPYPKEENDLIYQQSQQQRAIERGIRKAKTQQEMYKALGDDKGLQEATALLKKRQSSMRDFVDETGRTRRRDREQIVKTNDIKKKPIPKTPTDVPNLPQNVVKKDIPVPDSQVSKVKAPIASEVKQIVKQHDFVSNLPPLNPKLQKAISKVEEQIRKSPTEKGVLYNKNGFKLWEQQEGTSHTLDIEWPAKQGLLEGNIITHNHPEEDSSFSMADIKAALRFNVGEIRAITQNGTLYRFIPSADKVANKAALTKVEKIYAEEFDKISNKYLKQMKDGIITKEQFIKMSKQHETWEKVIPQLGMQYERIPPNVVSDVSKNVVNTKTIEKTEKVVTNAVSKSNAKTDSVIKRNLKDAKQGDKVQFMDNSGNELVGTIWKKEGKNFSIKDSRDMLHRVTKKDIIQFIL